MSWVRSLAIAIAGSSLAACSSVQFQDDPKSTPVVPVKAVVNSLKCGLAEAVVSDTMSRAGLYGAVAKVDLDVNVVQGVDASGGITAGIPISGGTITPSLNLTYSEVRTINSSIDFSINLTTKDAAICAALGVERGRDAGFSSWIGGVVASINEAAAGNPKAQMTQFVYESDFTVKRGVNGGVSAEIVPVKITTSAGSSRSDIQHLKVTIAPVHFVRGKKKKGGTEYLFPVAGARPFSVTGPWLMDTKSGPQRRGSFNLPVK